MAVERGRGLTTDFVRAALSMRLSEHFAIDAVGINICISTGAVIFTCPFVAVVSAVVVAVVVCVLVLYSCFI